MLPLLTSVGAPILGGLIGNIASSSDAEEAKRMRQQAIDQWKNIQAPSVNDQRVSLSQYQNAGQLNPMMEHTYQQGGTNLGNIQTDPSVRQAQHQALARLQDVSSQNGITAEDKDRLTQIQSENARQSKGQRDAISQTMAARGMGGSGMELASQLQAQQSGANRNAQQSMDVQAMGQHRALQAMMGAGKMAGQMRGQQFGEQSEAAHAQDLINQFNTRNQQGVAGSNIDRMNQAQGYNLQNSQNLSNRNTDLSNTEQMHNKGLLQQNFDNQTRIAGGISGQYNSMADADLQEAQRKRALWGGVGQGAGEAATAYGMYRR